MGGFGKSECQSSGAGLEFNMDRKPGSRQEPACSGVHVVPWEGPRDKTETWVEGTLGGFDS